MFVLDSLRGWYTLRTHAQAWAPLRAWAASRQAAFGAGVRGRGLQITAPGWQLQWGESQRPYLDGTECRLRLDAGLTPTWQFMLMTRDLAEAIEAHLYGSYTDSLQTRADATLPEEMRWLVMLPRARIASSLVAERFLAVASTRELGSAWVSGDFSAALAQATLGLLPAGRACVLLIQGGAVHLRCAMGTPQPQELTGLLRLAERAAEAAQWAQAQHRDPYL